MKYRLEATRVTADADAEMVVPHLPRPHFPQDQPRKSLESSPWAHEFSRIPTNPAEICTSPFPLCCLLTVVTLNAVTRALAIEYAKEGIRVNTIAPRVINTPMHKPETHDFLKGLNPVGRIGEVKEVVDAALFLTDATFTSGEILHVDGGAHAGKW